MSDLVLPETAACHLAYHARMAARFGAEGDLEECASEALLAWAILDAHGGRQAAESLTSDLPDGRIRAEAWSGDSDVRRRAHALALELLAHYVSEGQADSAALYESLAIALTGR